VAGYVYLTARRKKERHTWKKIEKKIEIRNAIYGDWSQ